MSRVVGKTGLLYITVNERSPSKLHNDALADVITDCYGSWLVIMVTMGVGDCRLLQRAARAPFTNTGKGPKGCLTPVVTVTSSAAPSERQGCLGHMDARRQVSQ